ncbi:MAG: transcription antitermination factor NusB [Chitinophagaceae bacterium]
MISRRNIRVKVMQTLYSAETAQGEMKPGEPLTILQKHFDQTRGLLVYLVYVLTEIARYAETDARKKASKHLPTEADLNINIKIAGNELLWKLLEDPSYQKAFKEDRPDTQADKEEIRKLYLELAATPEYKVYITEQSRDTRSEKQMLEFILGTLMLPNENFVEKVEEYFTNWDDDCDVINQLILSWLQKPGAFNFMEIISKDKLVFAKELLQAVVDKQEVTMGLIKPKLKNWDSDRIAVLDMILMQMGVCEFLYFETIPPKVTINEYIDLAKEYSTPQSGQFVNGILDNIHKDLLKDDQMHKISFVKKK